MKIITTAIEKTADALGAIVAGSHQNQTVNSLLTIQIYKFNGLWCFSDENHNLINEPFVLGMSDLINDIIMGFKLGGLHDPYRIIFSENKFPQYQGHLLYHAGEFDGVWYTMATVLNPEMNEKSPKGWLCPATLKYFEVFPKTIYFKIEPVLAK